MTKIGAHVSAAGDLSLAPLTALSAGAECFQFFSRSPQGGPAKPITDELAARFRQNLKKAKQEAYIHAPYFINLASAKPAIYHGSIKILREELARADKLSVRYLMTHLGSAKDLGVGAAGRTLGLKKVIDALAEILADRKIGRAASGAAGRVVGESASRETEFLIEMSAGSGAIIGDSFEEIKAIVTAPKLKKYQIGICFDTAHAFASGYDLSAPLAVKKTFLEFDRILGLKNLKLIHANDSLTELGSHKDRHAHIGQGKIGAAGFKAIVKFAAAKKINLVLETPDWEERVKDIARLKKMRAL